MQQGTIFQKAQQVLFLFSFRVTTSKS